MHFTTVEQSELVPEVVEKHPLPHPDTSQKRGWLTGQHRLGPYLPQWSVSPLLHVKACPVGQVHAPPTRIVVG